MRVVVIYGGRKYGEHVPGDHAHNSQIMKQRFVLRETLNDYRKIYGFKRVIVGGAKGADKFGQEWALANGIPVDIYRANWSKYGHKAAGPIRNQMMIDFGMPTLGIAFPGGNGTQDMTDRLRIAEIEIIEIG